MTCIAAAAIGMNKTNQINPSRQSVSFNCLFGLAGLFG
jgi:hypothetical protein